MTLHNYRMTDKQKAWHLKEILSNAKNTPNMVPFVPAEPDSYPSLSYSSSAESFYSSDGEYYKWRRHAEKYKNKRWSKTRFGYPIEKCAKLKAKIFTAAYKSKYIAFKLDEDPLQQRVYFLYFMNSLKIVLSTFSETYMLLMDYPSIRGEKYQIMLKIPLGTFCMHI